MRILVNMPSQYGGKPSGVARVGFSLLEHLLAVTDHTFVLRSNWKRDDLPDALRVPRVEVVEIPRPRFIALDVLAQFVTMPIFCRRHRIDVVLNVDPYGTPVGGRARVTIVHDLYFHTIPEQIGRRAVLTNGIIFKAILAGTSTVVCVSDATRRDVVSYYPFAAKRCVTVHSDSTLPMRADAGRPPASVDGRFILAVGNATPNKNFAALGRAYALLHERDPSLKLVHVGIDEHDTLTMAIPDGPARASLLRLSKLDDSTLAALYRAAACLCIPSLYEGFCLPILEAQQFGCPVVCSDRSCLPEIAGDAALYFDPLDSSAIADALARVLGDQSLRDDLKARGEINRRRFSWRDTALRYAELIEAAA